MNPITAQQMGTQTKSNRAPFIKLARELHLYLGTLFAPAILFFAFTGSLQLFSLHEGHPGDTYQAPAWIQKLASIHKKQTVAERHGPPPNFAGNAQRKPDAEQPRPPQQGENGPRREERGESKYTLALKWFFLASSLGLIFSTFLGIYMAFKFNRSRTLVWGLLFLGTAIPVALIALMA
jgi:hypothetical protein